MTEQVKDKKVFNFSVLRRVFKFAIPYKRKFFWSLFLAIFLAIISPIRPWLIQITINKGMQPGAQVWFLKGAEQVIIGITIIQLGILLVETVCRFVFTFFTASLGQMVVKDMRVATYQKVINLNLSQFEN